MSACIAERFATVSSSDSPLVCEESAMLRLMTSAERRLAAISKVVRVRVEGSKNRLNTLLPRSNGDRKSTRLNSSHSQISYAVFCLKKKTRTKSYTHYS